MNKGKLILASLALLALPLAAAAQTRRKPAAKPSAQRKAPAAKAPAGKTSTGGVTLTAEDMSLLVEGLNFRDEIVSALATSAEDRKAFAVDMRRVLGGAAEARATGLAERPEIKLQLEVGRAYAISQRFFRQQEEAGVKEVVSEAEIDTFMNEPASSAQFEAFVADYVKNGPGRGAPITEEQRKQLRFLYGRMMVGTRKAVAAGLDRDRTTQLVVMRQQSRLLAGAYVDDAARRFEPTEAEVDAYIAQHPELDSKASRAKVEEILRRARAGEDFVKLANEFTEDPSGKGRGGDLGWFGRKMMVKPFEDAAFALKPGELSGVVESPFGFHIIKLEETRVTDGGVEELHARHILIRYAGADADEGGRPVSPRDRAGMAVAEQKRDRALDELATRHRVSVAEDYIVGIAVIAPEGAPPSSGKLPAVVKPPAQTKPAVKPKPKAKTPARRGH